MLKHEQSAGIHSLSDYASRSLTSYFSRNPSRGVIDIIKSLLCERRTIRLPLSLSLFLALCLIIQYILKLTPFRRPLRSLDWRSRGVAAQASGVGWTGVEWSGVVSSGVVWIGVEWNGGSLSGVDWSGLE